MTIYLLAGLVAAIVSAAIVYTANAATSERATLQAQTRKSENVLRFFQTHRWLVAPNREKCRQVPWQRSCTIGRQLVRRHKLRLARTRHDLYRYLPATGDWRTATRIVQRVYPGTESWLLSCSSAEGGHGRWVWYGGRPWQGYHIGGDTVGRNLQFRYSTFAPYYRHALSDVKHRGFVPPYLGEGYDPWLAPMGQAITGAYMRYHGKDGYHWSASNGNGC